MLEIPMEFPMEFPKAFPSKFIMFSSGYSLENSTGNSFGVP